jgi:hypothetical protein
MTFGVAASTRGTPASAASTAAHARPAHSCIGGHPGRLSARIITNSPAAVTAWISPGSTPRYSCSRTPNGGSDEDGTAATVTVPASSIIRAATPTGLARRAASPAAARSCAAWADSATGTR